MPKFRSNDTREWIAPAGHGLLAITDGEVNFLWSFIQGSLANRETWDSLLNSYGFCERHAWIHLSIEAAFREQYLLGPTILYAALIEKALRVIGAAPRISRYLLEHRLRAGDACLLCALNITDASGGASSQGRLHQGYDARPLQAMAISLREHWESYVCDACRTVERAKSNKGERRCRRHLLADLRARRPVERLRSLDMLHDLHPRLVRYQESFLAGKPRTNDRECASLIAAVGWCSGWQPLLDLLRRAPSDADRASARTTDGIPT
jgi:hypothetical protein